jgi:hypothetical protein
MRDIQSARLATLVALAEKKPLLGRTAVMKLCYFLQTLRDVPLGYRFTLYSYGPFDSSVLSDLSTAETLGGIESKTVFYSGGYGYEISPAGRSRSVRNLASGFVKKYRSDIDWALERFAKFGSADLELLSTIIYVDREFATTNERLTADALAEKVREVKPHFAEEYIRGKVDYLRQEKMLRSVRTASGRK